VIVFVDMLVLVLVIVLVRLVIVLVDAPVRVERAWAQP
jgi:hypothetical protein